VPPPATLESVSSRDSIHVHLRWPLRPVSDSASAVPLDLVAASEAALWNLWINELGIFLVSCVSGENPEPVTGLGAMEAMAGAE
jgi:hypothetical protein